MSKYNFHLPNKPATKSGSILSYDYSDNRTFIPQPLTFSRGSNATYIDKDGVIKSTTGDLPRINGQDGSLLLEPQAVNNFLWSSDISKGAWDKDGVLVDSSNLGLAPDGSYSAQKVTRNRTGVWHQFRQQKAGNVMSIFVKNIDAENFYLRSSSGAQFVYYNFASKTVSSNSLKVEYYPNDWIRLYTSPHQTYKQFGIGQTEINQIDDNKSVYVWGAQIENNILTSYIPTTNTTVTRLAETAINAGTENVFNSKEGVLYLEAAALSDTGTERRITITDGDFLNLIEIRLAANGDLISFIQDPALNNNFAGTYVLTEKTKFFKCALKWKANDYAFYVNGVEVATNNSITINQTGLDRIDFSRPNQATPFYGKIKELKVFNKALTDTELQQLTTQ